MNNDLIKAVKKLIDQIAEDESRHGGLLTMSTVRASDECRVILEKLETKQDPHFNHNVAVAEAITLLLENTSSPPELMVCMESIMAGVIYASHKLYGVAPAATAEVLSMAIDQASIRYGKEKPL